MKKTFYLFAIIFFHSGCFNTVSNEKKARLEKECAQTDSVRNLVIHFRGFDYETIDSVLIKELRNDDTIDSFYIIPDKATFDPSQMKYSADIFRPLCIHDTYDFYIRGQKIYRLSSMTMFVRTHFSMLNDNYGCDMYQYKLNGFTYTGANPVFVKEGYFPPGSDSINKKNNDK